MIKLRSLIRAMAAASLLSLPTVASAAIGLTSQSAIVSENFNSMWDGDAALLAMPSQWRVDRNLTAPRRVCAWDEAVSDVMYSGGVSLASNAKNGTWNFGASDDPSDRAIGGLTTTVSGGTRGVSIMTSIHNADADLIIDNLSIDYNIEKYRKGANAAGFAMQLYYSFDGSYWISAGDDFYTFFDPDSETIGAEIVPISVTPVSGRTLRTHVEPGEDFYLAWNISVASGTTPDKAPGLALDDVKIMASFVETDDDWVDPVKPDKNPSGIYLRGEVNGWVAESDWEFDKTDDPTVFELKGKVISGSFKIGDASWSAACNYGTNGTNIMMDKEYELVSDQSSGNISCGSNTYDCTRIVLTIPSDGSARLLLESNDDPTGLTSVYVIGDCNGWDFMNGSGELKLNESTGLFSGRMSMTASADGLSHWRIYQRLGMAGSWGLETDATESSVSGTLVKGATGNVATASGTYDVSFNISTGAYELTKVSSVPTEMKLDPSYTILVPRLPEKVKVLSLNNSLIHYNDQALMFNDIASAMGVDAVWTKHTLLGKSLAAHWNEGDGLAEDGQPGAKMLVRSETWSHIILQEQSSLPRTDVETFRSNVGRWVEYIRANCPNPNAVIILPVNWAYAGDWDNFTTYNNTFIANYIDVANEFGVTICPVISAYQSVYDKEGADGIASWFQDDRHPTDKSTYMAACMEYGLIFGVDPADITYHPSSVTDEEAASMRAYASEALNGWVNTVDHTAGKVRFSVDVIDDFGISIDPGLLQFSVDNGGELNGDNEFITTAPGDYNVTVTNGTFTKVAKVRVAEAVTVKPEIPCITLNADNLQYSQNFDGMGDAADASMPEGWRVDRQTSAPRTVGTFSAASETTMYSGGVSLPSNAKNGIWNFGDNAGTDRAVGGITTGVDGGSRAINVYAHFLNDGRKNLENITLSYDVEKYRNGSNSAGFTVQLYYSADGTAWTAAGDDFKTAFDPSESTSGMDVVPGETVSASGVLPDRLQAGCDLYLAWSISVTSGSNCASAPALAIDNVQISASVEPVPVYDYYIYVEDQTGYDAMGAYAYGDKEIWGAWPGQAPIDEVVIDGCTYKVFGHNEASGSYSLIINNWNRSSQLPDYAITGGRDYYFLATSEKLTEKASSVEDNFAEGGKTVKFDGATIYYDGATSLKVYNMTGVVVASATGGSVSVVSVAPGVYIVEAQSGADRAVARILKR